MARYRDAKCKLCRREGEKLFLKGDRCYSNKCAIEKRNSPPGQHGKARVRKSSKYNVQLREKQKLRKTYGLLERQFRNYFHKAAATKSITGTTLLQVLERRLDNVVYRWASRHARTGASARSSQPFQVNGKKVNIPSYLVSPGDRIGPHGKSRDLFIIREAIKNVDARQAVPYLDLDTNKLEGVFTDIPSREVIPVPVDEQLIVELYSK
jgi:small subunit ribosomal protein S4